MGQFIHLPDGTMVIVNGANKGTAGYTNATYNKAMYNGQLINTEGHFAGPHLRACALRSFQAQGTASLQRRLLAFDRCSSLPLECRFAS